MKRKRETDWSNLVLKWFLTSTLFCICVLATSMYQRELREFFGLYSGEGTFGNGVKRIGRSGNKDTAFQYMKYTIDARKSRRLNDMLQKMLETYSRLNDDYFGFKVTQSDQISVSRDIVDARPKVCRNRKFNYSSFPTVSVICPFYNEALTPLIRHTHALLKRTPPHLLVEIILIDDMSTFQYLGKDLEEYFKALDERILLIRNEERKGLILSRMAGARVARGEVLVFLDAHMEVGHGWVEPLLERLNNEEQLAVQSDMPPILTDTFDLDTGKPPEHRGGFGWDLSFMWFPLPPYLNAFKRSDWDPMPLPVTQGAGIAIRKSYFDWLGGFDQGLSIWGGEHFDISFNIWMTGGRFELVPCSKVGHIYKENKYGFGGQDKTYVVVKNNLRVAAIWMDEYKDLVRTALRVKLNPEPDFTEDEWKSIEERRRKLRSKGQRRSFTWFLRNILPEQTIPSADDILFGNLGSSLSKECVYVTHSGHLSMTPSCKSFSTTVSNMTFSIDKYLRFKFGLKCVGPDDNNMLQLVECPCVDNGRALVYWTTNTDGQLVHHGDQGDLCASLVKSTHDGQQLVMLLDCDTSLDEQKWAFMYHFKR